MTTDDINRVLEAIDSAEEILDPLDGLIEKVAVDPGAAFGPEVLEALAALKQNDRASFETLRERLKKAGCRITALDQEIAKKSGEAGGRGPTQADVLIELALSAELFHAPDRTGYADIAVNGHRETWRIRSTGFRRWPTHRFFEETQGAPNSEALQAALNAIEAKADFDAPERIVHVRIGGLDGKLYLDLGNEAWQAVEIDPQGWRVTDKPPVRFRRSAGMKPLPIPVSGGLINELKPFLNVKSHHDFVLVIAFLLAALRPRGPYPVIGLNGEQGSAKSTLCAILKALLDPNTAPLRALPREDRDLFIAANNGHILAFDNVSGLSSWISDTLCRLSTGGSFAVRELYKDQDEVLFDAIKPVILNGIEEIITRPDLADRAILLTLEPIPEKGRKPEQELWDKFEIARPRIMGSLLDTVAHGLAMMPKTQLERLPRMADFARWVTACETALWLPGTFLAAYSGNLDKAVLDVLESDLVAVALRPFIAERKEWKGTASELLSALGSDLGEPQNRSKEWPGSAKALSGRLRRAATLLRKVGVEIDFNRKGHGRARTIHITRAPENSWAQPSAPSAPSASPVKPNGSNGITAHSMRTVVGNADDSADDGSAGSASNVRTNPLKSNEMTAADGADENFPQQSEPEQTDGPAWSGRL
jgi:hypothetical protein